MLAILGGALLAVYQNWETIKPKLLEFWGSVSSSIRGVVEDMSTWIKAKLDSVVGYFSEKVKALANMAREARQWVADIASSVGDKAGNLAENIGGTVLKGLDGFRANG